jgi:hypothetical protein
MSFDPKALRREILAHCLTFAESDESYAKWAARNYETNPEFAGLFDGLERRFLADLSRAKADKKLKEAAHATNA